MQILRRFYAPLFFIVLSACAPEAHADRFGEEPLHVRLETESALIPIYIVPFLAENSELPPDYVKNLENIFLFDLNHNGRTISIKNSPSEDLKEQTVPPRQFSAFHNGKEHSALFAVKVSVQNRNPEVSILDIRNKTVKIISDKPFTGNLNEDRRIVHTLADTFYRALFSENGIASSRLLYTLQYKHSSDSSKWICEIVESDYDGADLRQITRENSICTSPTYIPPNPGYTGGSFLYVSYRSGQPKIYLSSLRGKGSRRLISLSGNQLMPAISLQRDKIAFISDVTGNPDLFLQAFSPETGAIGKPRQIFSARQATQGSPTFSPDGKKIAFVSNKDGSPKIYVMTIPEPGTDLKDIRPTPISRCNRENSAPEWSPDGTMLAYCSKGSGERQIWVYDFTTDRERQITHGKGNKENPSWAPNSLMLAYNTADPNSCEIFLTDLLGSEPVQITSGEGEKRFPHWELRRY